MNKLSEKFKHEKRMRRLLVIFIIAFLVLAAAFTVILMFRFGLIKPPDFLSALLGEDGEDIKEVIPGDDGVIYDALMNRETTEGITVTRNINAADAAVFFTELRPAGEYSLFNRVTLYADNRSITYINKIWRQDQRYRIETYDIKEVPIKTVICDGEYVYVTYHNDSDGESVFPASGFTLEQQAGMPSVDDILKRLTEKEREKTDVIQDIENISVSLIQTRENSLYHVEYDYLYLLLHEQLYISIENGFVVRAETRETSGILTYSLETDFMQTGIAGYTGSGDIFAPGKDA